MTVIGWGLMDEEDTKYCEHCKDVQPVVLTIEWQKDIYKECGNSITE